MLLHLLLFLLQLSTIVVWSCSKKKKMTSRSNRDSGGATSQSSLLSSDKKKGSGPTIAPHKQNNTEVKGKELEVESTQKSERKKAKMEEGQDEWVNSEEDTRDDVPSLEPADLDVPSEEILLPLKKAKANRDVKMNSAEEPSARLREEKTPASERSIREQKPRKLISKQTPRRRRVTPTRQEMPTAIERKKSSMRTGTKAAAAMKLKATKSTDMLVEQDTRPMAKSKDQTFPTDMENKLSTPNYDGSTNGEILRSGYQTTK